MKNSITIVVFLFCFSFSMWAQESEETHKKLEFLVGEWESISVNHNKDTKSTGKSFIQWILNKKWLQWRFTAQLESGPIEVLTLINYDTEKKQYAFYSFNSISNEMRPHYGNWIEVNKLRLKIKTKDEETWVDFRIKENGNFDQIHSRISSSGQRIIRSTTSYSKISSQKSTM